MSAGHMWQNNMGGHEVVAGSHAALWPAPAHFRVLYVLYFPAGDQGMNCQDTIVIAQQVGTDHNDSWLPSPAAARCC